MIVARKNAVNIQLPTVTTIRRSALSQRDLPFHPGVPTAGDGAPCSGLVSRRGRPSVGRDEGRTPASHGRRSDRRGYQTGYARRAYD
jgi:hypothetical protein